MLDKMYIFFESYSLLIVYLNICFQIVLYQIILCFDFDSNNIHTNIIIAMVPNHITEKKC